MNADLNINNILLQVKRLNKEDQLNLLEKLALLIRKSEQKENKTKLTSISGVGLLYGVIPILTGISIRKDSGKH